MKSFRYLSPLLLIVLSTVSALAQPPGGPPGGFPGGGRGMGGPGGALGLVGMPEVQKELHLTDEQKTKAQKLLEAQQEKMQAAFANGPPQDREKFREQMDAAASESLKAFGELLEPAQSQRWEQLRLRREGTAGLIRQEIVEKLKLTEDQQKRLAELDRPRGGFFNFPSPEENKKREADAFAVLDESQQKQWTELLGAPFEFPAPRFGPGGPGGMLGEVRKIVSRFDKDGDGRLNRQEREAAREGTKSERGRGFGPPGGFRPPGGGPGGPGGPPGFGRSEPAQPGRQVQPEEVEKTTASLYDSGTLRTLFLDFADKDWEAELADFNNTDVEVPATLRVDGQEYSQIGVHFRGMSSFGMVPAGSKRSFNLALDFVNSKQRLEGYKTLNLLNSHEDPSFLHTVLYFDIARQFLPAPKANFVRLVINGENWGMYVNAQQFNKEFIAENFPKSKGTRWKVSGSPGGRGGLDFIGDDVAAYKRIYAIKSDDKPEAWTALINLCRVLSKTPDPELVAALEPILDVDGALWFLALENALINGDGYWIRASDYCLYLDQDGKIHVIPHDANETFQPPMGPGMGGPGGPRGGGPGNNGNLDPLVGLDDASKPLRSRLLKIPELRAKYLAHVRQITRVELDWNTLGPKVARYKSLIEDEVATDTKKLSSTDEFQKAVSDQLPTTEPGARFGHPSLRQFAESRRKFLLEHPAIKELPE